MFNLGFLRQLRDVAIVVFLLALPFFFLRASIRKPEELTVVDTAVMKLTSPLQYGVSVVARSVSSVIGTALYWVDVKGDNDKLAYENARLHQQLRELNAVQGENVRLKKLLGLKESTPAETVSAVVIGKTTTDYFRVAQLTLDNPGVAVGKNMPVLGIDGAVGTVLRAAGDRVDVLLTVDAGFGVDVVVERTGARGFVRGVGDPTSYAARVEYVQRTDELSVGDVLVTSGVGCRFPKGIPVARVSKIVRKDFGTYQAVEAKPTVDFSRLDHVLIVLTDDKNCSPHAERSAPKGK